uniref:Uncharacterized protein n=1 Tax=Ditylenchus dipsaci TaxID=166011 RepID=A0A915DBL9_9BILA
MKDLKGLTNQPNSVITAASTMTTTAVRDTLCSLRPMEIPRPKCAGFQFVPTRGRMGFYMSIKRDGEKYGIQLKNQGPRRPSLPDPRAWGSTVQIASNDSSMQTRESRTEAGQLIGSVSAATSIRLNQSRSSLVSAEDLLKMKAAQVLPTQRQIIIPEEPEELKEPEPDYYYSDNTYSHASSQAVAMPITNAPPAPPLPISLVLNMRRGSTVDSRSSANGGGQTITPKPATKRQMVSKKKCRYEYLIEEEDEGDQVLKL